MDVGIISGPFPLAGAARWKGAGRASVLPVAFGSFAMDPHAARRRKKPGTKRVMKPPMLGGPSGEVKRVSRAYRGRTEERG